MRRLLFAALLLTGCASLNPDTHWERLQARYPRLYQLDNTPAKSWGVHVGVTLLVGHGLAATPWLSKKGGLRSMCGFYVLRESYGVLWGGNRKYGDALMDFALPCLVAEAWPW